MSAARFTGHIARKELLGWYARARVVVVASRFDSFSQAGLEAMAAGRPVVCLTRAGLAEIAEPGDDGLTRFRWATPWELVRSAGTVPAGRRHRGPGRSVPRAPLEARCAPEVVAEAREAVYEEARSLLAHPPWRTG